MRARNALAQRTTRLVERLWIDRCHLLCQRSLRWQCHGLGREGRVIECVLEQSPDCLDQARGCGMRGRRSRSIDRAEDRHSRQTLPGFPAREGVRIVRHQMSQIRHRLLMIENHGCREFAQQ